MKFKLSDRFEKNLPSDPLRENTRRQVVESCFSYVTPQKTNAPKMLHFSEAMGEELGLTVKELHSEEFLNIFTGNALIPNSSPYAMCYGGHQFGNWAGQLGDGRAINLAEIEHNNRHWVLQLKGAGPTPYSRTADGLAVLRSSVREYLCSEAMYHLGINTTRALSIALTGEEVLRDVLYNGNPAYEKGAIVCRVAPSFLRFGNYEIFAARNDVKNLKILVDFTIKNHFPHLGSPSKETYLAFFKEVAAKTLETIVHWQRVGFVHGVMNTDNLSILGLTIDYGPYGWLEGYDPRWTPNTTDREHKRYRYENQPNIGLWNLLQLANALYPLIEEAAPLEAVLETYKTTFEQRALEMHKSKLGLEKSGTTDRELFDKLEETLQLTETDMTLFFRKLSSLSKTSNPKEAMLLIHEAFYKPKELTKSVVQKWETWFSSYLQRLKKETNTDTERKENMNAVNPKYVLRNYMAQLAIEAAEKGDYSLIDELFVLLKNPYDEQPNAERWFAKRPEWARHKIGCSMLSCSS
jgi:uncharacterized protein YdiU (UPF0061 family)